MHSYKTIFPLFFICISTLQATAQDRPLRFGLKVGMPNIIGVNVEYVTPWLDKRLAGTIDFSNITFSVSDSDLRYTYVEVGGNYYFFKDGRGLYGHLSYGYFDFFYHTHYDDSYSETFSSVHTLNTKLGAKLGGLFYFRPEIGLGVALNNPIVTDYEYDLNDNPISKDELPWPRDLMGSLIFNLGIGFAL